MPDFEREPGDEPKGSRFSDEDYDKDHKLETATAKLLKEECDVPRPQRKKVRLGFTPKI